MESFDDWLFRRLCLAMASFDSCRQKVGLRGFIKYKPFGSEVSDAAFFLGRRHKIDWRQVTPKLWFVLFVYVAYNLDQGNIC